MVDRNVREKDTALRRNSWWQICGWRYWKWTLWGLTCINRVKGWMRMSLPNAQLSRSVLCLYLYSAVLHDINNRHRERWLRHQG